jgi:hypothetical protein
MRSWHGLPWNGVFLAGCLPLFRSTSELFVEARNIRDGIIPKAERWVLHDFPLLGSGDGGKAHCRFSVRSEE